MQSLGDNGSHIVLQPDADPAYRDRAVVLEHIDERAARPPLYRSGGHDDDLAQGVDQHPHIDELSGPELKVGIRKFTLELDRSRGLIDLIVDHDHLAAVNHRLAVGCERIDRQRRFALSLAELWQILLWQAEED